MMQLFKKRRVQVVAVQKASCSSNCCSRRVVHMERLARKIFANIVNRKCDIFTICRIVIVFFLFLPENLLV